MIGDCLQMEIISLPDTLGYVNYKYASSKSHNIIFLHYLINFFCIGICYEISHVKIVLLYSLSYTSFSMICDSRISSKCTAEVVARQASPLVIGGKKQRQKKLLTLPYRKFRMFLTLQQTVVMNVQTTECCILIMHTHLWQLQITDSPKSDNYPSVLLHLTFWLRRRLQNVELQLLAQWKV